MRVCAVGNIHYWIFRLAKQEDSKSNGMIVSEGLTAGQAVLERSFLFSGA